MTAILPVIAGHGPVQSQSHREIPVASRTGAESEVVSSTDLRTILAIDLEGTEVCDWLTSNAITCVLLNRVPGEGLFPRSGSYPKSPMALEDAQRTVGLVRFHAAEWHIDPHKIGVLGFSAGGASGRSHQYAF